MPSRSVREQHDVTKILAAAFRKRGRAEDMTLPAPAGKSGLAPRRGVPASARLLLRPYLGAQGTYNWVITLLIS